MKPIVTLLCIFLFGVVLSVVTADNYVGGYLMLPRRDASGAIVGMSELAALANNAATIPLNRIWLAFFAPTLVYLPNSNTLQFTGLNVSSSGDYGFAEIKNYTQILQKAGVDVFLSMGGWNYNCYPYYYMRYSVGGYGTSTPNYWKIQQFGNGDMNQCNESNQFCYVCEPPSEGTSDADFQIFPEPSFSSTWQQAKAWVASAAPVPPVWNEDMIPGNQYVDPKTGISTKVPGNNMYATLNRDPYQDLVYLAKDLGVAGVDIDYEEFWHADFFKTGPSTGPWNLTQTVYKYAAIAYDVATNIKAIQPTLKLSTAGGAVGAWQGNWWGGNLKGVWFYTKKWFPFIMDFMSTGANAGGINVMSYDLSDNPQFHECPDDNSCPLDSQVAYYMNTYQVAGIQAAVGYEISTPAYPDKAHDPTHQLPLTTSMLSSITSNTQSKFPSGFLWELYKPADSSDHATATQTAQAICKSVMPSSPRCSGTIPGTASGNICTPGSCNVCDACCKSYLADPTACNGCVASECHREDEIEPVRQLLVAKNLRPKQRS
eukprot:c2334_g1_i1.p1 GENE.c2334_g1_i1~~c2334_g1_i1.p1  ORF type:complete len:556 (+),score=141.43 c2334_g1_i1:41-1669(+)